MCVHVRAYGGGGGVRRSQRLHQSLSVSEARGQVRLRPRQGQALSSSELGHLVSNEANPKHKDTRGKKRIFRQEGVFSNNAHWRRSNFQTGYLVNPSSGSLRLLK